MWSGNWLELHLLGLEALLGLAGGESLDPFAAFVSGLASPSFTASPDND